MSADDDKKHPIPLESGRAILAMSDYEDADPFDPFERFRGMTFEQMMAVDNPIGRFVRDIVSPAVVSSAIGEVVRHHQEGSRVLKEAQRALDED